MNTAGLLATACAAMALLFGILFLVARRVNNFGVVDIAWSYAFGAVALFYGLAAPGWATRRMLITACVVMWSLRLGTHLAVRVISHHPQEDSRYRQLREDWRDGFNVKMAAFFQVQGLSVVVLATAFLVSARNPSPTLHPLEIAGLALWLIAVGGEALADAQLSTFKRTDQSRTGVCNVGLWRYSRHPNYFFEWLIWVAYFVFALPSPFGWVAIIGPGSILWLLLRVTGIPMTEEQSLRTRGDAYRAYQRTTSAFFPLPPKQLPVFGLLNMIDRLLEKNVLPDWLVRAGIRRLLAERLRDESVRYDPNSYVADLKRRPLAEDTRAANEQHYEVPTRFYQLCLGKRLKYSGCLYHTGTESLDEAEEAMLALYVERAQLADGQKVLELGCGWGSLSLYLAERFPAADITAVSNSRTQKTYIDTEARKRGLTNLRILTCDMNAFDIAPEQFDRVVSVEMFEHMKNYDVLLSRVARWLKPDGRLFVHIFTHQKLSYHFVSEGPNDWMSRHFFTGGQMPAHDLLKCFQDHLCLEREWKVNGTHYQRTAEHWLKNMDAHRDEILPLFAETYGAEQAKKWWAYWRTFFLSCAELWGYRGGEEWLVSHYLFNKQR